MRILNTTLAIILSMASLLCTSCQNEEYINAIPAESTLLLSIDPARANPSGLPSILQSVLQVDKTDECGVDLSSKIYLFEDAQGNIGLCARVNDLDELTELLNRQHIEKEEKRNCHFALLPNRWLLGYTDQAILLMGPIVPTAKAETQQLMARYLKADESQGASASPLMARLDSLHSAMALVCQVSALPQQLAPILTLGAPAKTDPSQILLSADLQVEKGSLWVEGQLYSPQPATQQALNKTLVQLRPIHGKYLNTMNNTDALGLFVNVDGRQYVDMLKRNQQFSQMLLAINAAIDMDNIIRGMDGEVALISPSMGNGQFQLQMAAEMKRLDWMADIDYWKQSVPKGGTLGDWGRDCHFYTDGQTSYYFGLTSAGQYMSGSSAQRALASVKPAAQPLPDDVQQRIKGKRQALVIHLQAMAGDKAQAINALLQPLFGKVNRIVFTR